MKKSLFGLAIAFSLAVFGAGGAQAQTLLNTFQTTSGNPVDITSARFVDLTAGAQSVTDFNGLKETVNFVTPAAAFMALATVQANFVPASPGSLILVNVSVAKFACKNGVSVVTWSTGNPWNYADNCAFINAINARAKR